MTYEQIVEKRKNYELDLPPGLINQSEKGFDEGYYLDPWAKWYKSIPANILVVGQDWGNLKYYEENLGFDSATNPTCRNLIQLFKVIGLDICTPISPNPELRLHFANIIPFIRAGKMQGQLELILDQKTVNGYALDFMDPLLELIKPKIIITLGLSSYKGILSIFGKSIPKYQTLKSQIEISPFDLPNGSLLFPMYHCGASVINRSRSLEDQKKDWSKLNSYM